MDAEARSRLELEVRGRHERGDIKGAAEVALRGYGAEIFGFLAATHRSEEDAEEVFSAFCEDVWRGLPKFGWECTFRTWAYTLARHASYRFRKGARRRGEREMPLPSGPLSAVVAEVRTETQTFMRTQTKDRFAELRDALPDEDRALLVLRVDKDLAWTDIARVMLGERGGEGAARDEAALKREAARLRKRFQLVKERLLEEGRRAGLVGRSE